MRDDLPFPALTKKEINREVGKRTEHRIRYENIDTGTVLWQSQLSPLEAVPTTRRFFFFPLATSWPMDLCVTICTRYPSFTDDLQTTSYIPPFAFSSQQEPYQEPFYDRISTSILPIYYIYIYISHVS